MAKRGLVAGIGINDADYVVDKKVCKSRKERWLCPYYSRWKAMILRCYSGRQASYENTFVCEEWLTFSNFRKWMITQDWEGKELDKDLLGDGTLYSPTNCTFVPSQVNKFMTNALPERLHQGGEICFCKRDKVYRISCSNPLSPEDNKTKGVRNTEAEAIELWCSYKYKYAIDLAETLEDRRLAQLLIDKYKPKQNTNTSVTKSVMRQLLKIRNVITDPTGGYEALLIRLGATKEDIISVRGGI